MKTNTKTRFLLVVLLAFTMLISAVLMLNTKKAKAQVEDKGTIEVYFIGGQSNAVGFGYDPTGALAAEDARFKNGFDNVLYYSQQERWGSSRTIDEFEPVKLGQGVTESTTTFASGAEIGIAKALADSGKMSAVIKCAWGATHLYPDIYYYISQDQGTWTSPSYIKDNNVDMSENLNIGLMYNWFMETVTKGLQKLVDAGYTPVIKGMWWMQGEAETGAAHMAPEYEKLFRALISDIRSDITKISGQDCSTMPFIFGLPSSRAQDTEPEHLQSVRSQMTTVANDTSLPNVACVDTKGLVQQDIWHFDAASQRWLGEQFIATLNSLNDTPNFKEGITVFEGQQTRLEEPNGIRFAAKIANYDKANNYKYGMVILPTDILTSNNITSDYIPKLAQKNIDVVNLTCNVVNGDYDGNGFAENYIQGSIVNVKYKNLNREFTAIPYILDAQGNYQYSATVATTVARQASSDYAKHQTSSKEFEILNNFVNGGLNQATGKTEENGYNQANVTLDVPDTYTIYLGLNKETQVLPVTQTPAVNYDVNYTSYDENIVKVDTNGILTPVSAGSTKILVECAGVEKLVDLVVGYKTVGGITIDGQVSEAEKAIYGTNQLDCSDYSLINVKGIVIDKDMYFAITIEHNAWSAVSGTWYENDNFQILVDGELSNRQCGVKIVFKNGELELPTRVSCGYAKTIQLASGKQLTVVEFCVEGNNDSYKIQINANSAVGPNGGGFRWNSILWNDYNYEDYATVSSAGIVKNLNPIKTLDGVVIDGDLQDSVYNEISALTTTANGASLQIKGKKMATGVLLGFTINHTKSPMETTLVGGDWYTYMNMEFRINNGTPMFITTKGVTKWTTTDKVYGYCRSQVNTNGGYVSTYEIFATYEHLGVSSTDTLNVTFGGWFENGWAWLFGGGETNPTHIFTTTGIVGK